MIFSASQYLNILKHLVNFIKNHHSIFAENILGSSKRANSLFYECADSHKFR